MSYENEWSSEEDDNEEGVNPHLLNVKAEKPMKMDNNNNKAGSSKGSSMQMPGPSKVITDGDPSQSENMTKKPLSNYSLRKKDKIETMIFEAIKSLNERNGSSLVAICKYIESNYDVGDSKRLLKNMKRSLKEGVLEGRWVLVKRSYKISPLYKQSMLKNEKIQKKMLLQKERQMVNKKKKMLSNSNQAKPVKSSEVMEPKVTKSKAKKNVEEGATAKKPKISPAKVSETVKVTIEEPPIDSVKPMPKAIKSKKKMSTNTDKASKGSGNPARKSIASLIIPIKSGKKSQRLVKKTEGPAAKPPTNPKAAPRKRK